MKLSVVKYQNKLDLGTLEPGTSVLIFDKYLLKTSAGKKIIEKFPVRYGVAAGEKLKDLHQFPKHTENILKIISKVNSKELKVVSLGGGSVGDFAGFFASVFKRGVPLVHLPSTWLSALDSSHGGKTGLNAWHAKNQIGTFYSADEVILIRDLLLAQPEQRSSEATGELLKIALIDGKTLWKKVLLLQKPRVQDLWSCLSSAISAKYRVVVKDPYEKLGHRQILNLGHTLGHVIESELKVPHGQAVGQGLVFAVRWSAKLGILDKSTFEKIKSSFLFKSFEKPLQKSLGRLKPSQLQKILLMDKKKSQKDSLVFIFLKRPGRPLRKKVTVLDILEEVQRQRLDR